MTSVAMPAGTLRHGVLRWGLCFTLVAAAHAAVVLILLRTSPASDAEYVAGSAVEVVDLPQTPAIPTQQPQPELTPVADERQVDETPKEETKLPEQMAEVTLPKPEPPKQEPPKQESPAQAFIPPPPPEITAEAPSTAGVDEPQKRRPPSASVLRWQSGLYAEIKRVAYSSKVESRHGRLEIAVQMDRSGKMLESHILVSSGWPAIDKELLFRVGHAHLPKPPSDATDADLQITIPMNF